MVSDMVLVLSCGGMDNVLGAGNIISGLFNIEIQH